MILLLKLGLFLLSLLGWCIFAARRFDLRMELAPFITLSGMGVVLYIAGLLNIYSPVEYILWMGGIILLALPVRDAKARAPWMSLRTLILAIGAGWMLWLMRGGVLSSHDNMSHWGIMAKTMIRFDRLPNASNTAIEFVSYPPGTAGIIKYFCDFVGTSDGMMMFAQGLLLLTAVFTLLAFCKKGQFRGLALCAAAAALLLVGDITPADLRVDTLLAVQAVGALSVIAYYGPDQPRKAAFASMPGLVLLGIIKNSGLFFVALDLVVLTWFLLRKREVRRQNVLPAAAAWAAPLAAFWLWTRHVAMIFPEGGSSKHAVSLTGYESIFGEKTPEDMNTFNEMFFHRLVDFSQKETRCMFALLVLVLAAALWLWRSKALSGRYAALLGGSIAGAEVLYLACLWGTYAFSMNTSEMLCLASFWRYHLTGIIYLGGAVAIALLWGLQKAEIKCPALPAAVFAVLMAVVIAVGEPAQLNALYSRAPYRNLETQGEMLHIKQMYDLEEGKRYLFYTRGNPETDTWHMRYVARYVLNTDVVDFWQFEDQEFDYSELYGHYDYLILYAPDEEIRQFLLEGNLDPDAPYIELIQ